MQNILVTGGCGFIGSNFIRHILADPGFQGRVINLDKLTYAGNPRNLDGVAEACPGRYVCVRADIADAAAVERVFDEYGVDAVCHFAAESHVDRSILGPEEFLCANVLGTFRLLEAARRRKGKITRFHHVSTDEVYGTLGMEGKFTEQSPYQPSSPYSASKAASDHLVRAWHVTYGLPVTVSNCSNNYGPYQFPEKLIPLMILNAVAGKPLPVYGKGNNVRDWLYVEDHCAAVWLVMRKGREGETYNVGGGAEMPNIGVVRRVCRILDETLGVEAEGPRERLVRFVTDRPGHDLRYAIDSEKIRKELGWEPRMDFDGGLRRTVAWYLENTGWVADVQTGAYREWARRQYGEQA
jgi:dTDP-glucose 4,6-dehydratase